MKNAPTIENPYREALMRCKNVRKDMGEICRRNREREAALAQWRAAHTQGGLRSYCASELANLPPAPVYVMIDDDEWIAIDTAKGERSYHVFDGSWIKTPINLVECISHITGRGWMDMERVRQLIIAVCVVRRWDDAKIERY